MPSQSLEDRLRQMKDLYRSGRPEDYGSGTYEPPKHSMMLHAKLASDTASAQSAPTGDSAGMDQGLRPSAPPEKRVRVVLADNDEHLSMRLAALVNLAPDVATACEAQGELSLRKYGSASVCAVVAWMEAAYDCAQAQAELDDARDEQEHAARPLESLTQRELARLFQYNGLREQAKLLTYTPRGEAPAVPDSNPVKPLHSKPAGPPLVVRQLPGKRVLVNGVYVTVPGSGGGAEEVDGRMLADDAVADTSADGFDIERFKALYAAYRPELLDHVYHWLTTGVRQHELLDEAQLASWTRAETGLLADVAATQRAMADAADAATVDEALSLETVRVAHSLRLARLVRPAVDRLATYFEVSNATDRLMLADELDCHPLRDRVSGYIVAHLRAVTSTPGWADLVPTREQTRLLALAAASHSNPFGLYDSGEAATDAREMLAWSRETLEIMERCFEEAKEGLAEDERLAEEKGEQVASADHARKMLVAQEERIRVVRAFVAMQEANVQSQDA
jgi:hypothetical protein